MTDKIEHISERISKDNSTAAIQEDTLNYVETELDEINCDLLFRKIIFSSNVDIDLNGITEEDIAIFYSEKTASAIIARIDIKGDERNFPLRWIKLDFAREELLDLYDEYEEKKLTYNKEMFRAYDINCFNESNEIEPLPENDFDPYTTIITDKFHVSNKSINSVYQVFLEGDEFKTEQLLSEPPLKDTIYRVPWGGDSITNAYEVGSNKLGLEISYPGGVTSIDFFVENDSIVQKIVYSAD